MVSEEYIMSSSTVIMDIPGYSDIAYQYFLWLRMSSSTNLILKIPRLWYSCNLLGIVFSVNCFSTNKELYKMHVLTASPNTL